MGFYDSSRVKLNMMQNMDLLREAWVFQLSNGIRFLAPVQRDLKSSLVGRELGTLAATTSSQFQGISQYLV